MHYLWILLLIILGLKYVKTREPMTNADRTAHIIGMGYSKDTATRIANDSSILCDVPANTYGAVLPKTDNNVDIRNELDFKDYKLKIMSGQQYHEKLDNIERKVFQNFYGLNHWKKEYDKWLLKRKKKNDAKTAQSCRNFVSRNRTTHTTSVVTKLDLTDKLKTLTYLEQMNHSLIRSNYSATDYTTNPELDIRKIQYRSAEEDNLHVYNSYINWIYYLIAITLLLLLYSQSKLNLMSNFMVYIVVALLPILIYPYTFKFIQFLIQTLTGYMVRVPPEGAFMND